MAEFRMSKLQGFVDFMQEMILMMQNERPKVCKW